MGDEDGLTALEQIREDIPDLPVVMISTYDNPTYVARAIALGANDYILKDSSRMQMLDAIRRAAVASDHPSRASSSAFRRPCRSARIVATRKMSR